MIAGVFLVAALLRQSSANACPAHGHIQNHKIARQRDSFHCKLTISFTA